MSVLPTPSPVEGALRGETLSTPPLPPRVKGWRRLIDISDLVRAAIELEFDIILNRLLLEITML